MLTPILAYLGLLHSYAWVTLLTGPTLPLMQSVAPIQAAPTTSNTHPLRASKRGSLVDIFFSTGDRVKQGQILAKLEGPDGHPIYLLAPVVGHIGPALRHLGETLAAHATLAVITPVAPTR
jgi:Na+-translocating ferredoxin:NAD+ oxidoreductase RnfC subunit